MDILSLLAGFVIGVIFGTGAVIFYMRWKMTRQLNAMQQNMEGMFEATEELAGELDIEEEKEE